MAVLLMAAAHPFHVSICMIDHNAETNGIEITHKIFCDDLNLALEDLGVVNPRLGTEREHKDVEMYIERYLRTNFSLKLDGEEIEWKWIGREVEDDVLWVYLEGKHTNTPVEAEVTNTILIEVFEDQSNLTHVKVKQATKTMHFNRAEMTKRLYFRR